MSELIAVHGKACRTNFDGDIFSNFSQFVTIFWQAEEFSYNYFSDCFIIACSYSLIQFIFCTEATEGSPLDDGENDAQKFLPLFYLLLYSALHSHTLLSGAAHVSQSKVLVAKLVL
jgi:hypothetical protein